MATAINNSTEENKTAIHKRGDKFIWGIFITLFIISLIESYSASSREVASSGVYYPLIKHAALLGIGIACMVVIQHFHYRYIVRAIPFFTILTMFAMIYVLFAGERINGAQRAINILGFSLQPAEFAKIGIVLLIAWVMAKNQMVEGVRNMGVILAAIAVMAFGGLLFKQGLTNTILLMCISLSMMLIGGVQLKKFILVIIVYSIFGLAFLVLKGNDSEKTDKESPGIEAATEFTQEADSRHGTWTNRINRFLNPEPLYEQPISSINQQEIFSRMAQANGGIIGVMPGNSRECSRLPLAFSDYIYSIIIEDTGFVGAVLILILYLSLLSRAGFIASKCTRALPALLVMGMAVMISFQALFHMAINTGVFPVSGQPLPLISKGGSSIIVTCIAFGVMLSVSKYAATTATKTTEAKAEANILPDDLQAANPTQM